MPAVTSLDGRAFSKFMAAGTYFLRTYRRELDQLNVFPVPDGDTGSNMYLTARAALAEIRKVASEPLNVVAGAAAHGSLLGARGNSGVIFSQMLRGFAHTVRHRTAIDTFGLALAMQDAVGAARAALTAPVEGTIVSVAAAAADEASRQALHETDFYRLGDAVLRAAHAALERTPEQLPQLAAAGVVDSGGAGLVYFLEGVLRFLPDATARRTAFPRRPPPGGAFTQRQTVGRHRFCTEFIIEAASIDAGRLRELLARDGESVIVAGDPPALRVHVHAADPDAVFALARRFGTLARTKVDDMQAQHDVLIERPDTAFSVVALVPGDGFAAIARELGADITVPVSGDGAPAVSELVLAINATLADLVYVVAPGTGAADAVRHAEAQTRKTVLTVPARDVVAALAVLLAAGGRAEPPALEALAATAAGVRSGRILLHAAADGATLGSRIIALADALGARSGGLVTLYYGGMQKERDAQRYAAALGERFADVSVEYYYGGQSESEYWVSVER